MQRKTNLTHLILAVAVALGVTLLLVAVDAQAQIAFVSGRAGNAEIYVMNTDGGNQQNLTNNPASDHSPSWSPDGKRIVFVSDRDGHVRDGIHGRRTAEIYVMDADGGNQQNLTNHRSGDGSPSWSPDGKRIVFSSERDQGRDDPHNSEIYVMDADGGNPQNLTNSPNEDRYPSWSPNGERIAFRSFRDGNTDIYVMDADGGNLQNLTNNPHSDSSPAWLNSPFSVSRTSKAFATWGRVKQVDR